MLSQIVSRMDQAVVRFTPSGTPTSMGNAMRHRKIKRRSVNASLAAGNDGELGKIEHRIASEVQGRLVQSCSDSRWKRSPYVRGGMPSVAFRDRA